MATIQPSIIDLEPANPSRRQVFMKTLLWLMVWIFIAFIVFITLILVWWVLETALASRLTGAAWTNPLLPLILLVIAFLWTFIGSIILAWIYNLIFTEKYYDMNKMFSLTLFANIIIFLFFIGLYLLFAWNVEALFFVLAFHIIFTVFCSISLIEFSTNPNYSAVHMLWTAIWLVCAIVIFAIWYKIIDLNEWWSAIKIFLSLPPVLAYCLIPFWHGLREKIYFKFYESGNNFFYIPSLNEVMVDEQEADEVEVDMEG
jgi:hypothetical protein